MADLSTLFLATKTFSSELKHIYVSLKRFFHLAVLMRVVSKLHFSSDAGSRLLHVDAGGRFEDFWPRRQVRRPDGKGQGQRRVLQARPPHQSASREGQKILSAFFVGKVESRNAKKYKYHLTPPDSSPEVLSHIQVVLG
jgi:hypothetical protein